MNAHRVARLATLLLIMICAAGTAAVAALPPPPPTQSPGGAQIEVGSEDGVGNMPEVTPGDSIITEEEFNPTITCAVEPGDTIYDIIECLLDRIANPPPACPPVGVVGNPRQTLGTGDSATTIMQERPDSGDCVEPQDRSDFDVVSLPWPHFGVEVLRRDGAPMTRIMFRENDPGIQTTQLRVDNHSRIGRIGAVTETPDRNGEVIVTVNDTVNIIPTGRARTSLEINGAIMSMLRQQGFLVGYLSPYIYLVDPDPAGTGGIRRLKFRSTDTGIASSDLAILAPNDPELPVEVEDEITLGDLDDSEPIGEFVPHLTREHRLPPQD